jgi:hypothetical protein
LGLRDQYGQTSFDISRTLLPSSKELQQVVRGSSETELAHGVGIAIVDSKDLGRDDFISKFFSVGRPVLVKNALKASNTLGPDVISFSTIHTQP